MWIAQSVYHSLLLFYLPCFMLRHGECSAPHWQPNFAFVIYNGKRTECSPFRSVVIRVINKVVRPRSLQTELDDTKFCYQLITTITKVVML